MQALSAIVAVSIALGSSLPAAQESRSPFYAALVPFDENTSIVSTPDVNGDGIPDAVGWYWENNSYNQANFKVFRGVGDGTFVPVSGFTMNAANLQAAWAFEVGRFSADERDDYAVAFAGNSDNKVRVYKSSTGGLPALRDSWNEDFAVRSMAAADYDQDGLDDLVVAGDGVRMYRNTGDGALELSASLPAGSTVGHGELDGSPGPDLFVLDGMTLQLVSGSGATMTGGPVFEHGLGDASTLHSVCGDIDGDLDDDIVLFSDAGISVVLRQLAPGSFVQESLVQGGPATDLADIDGDGDLDGLCCGSGGPSPTPNLMPSTFRISLNDGTGRFQVAQEMIGFGAFRLGGAVDVDQDGDLDLVAGRAVIFNRGGFDMETQPSSNLGPGALSPSLFIARDLDRDGDPDALWVGNDWLNGIRSWRNDGMGRMTLQFEGLPRPAGSHAKGPGYPGDFDGDGDLDIIYYNWATTTSFIGMRLLRNQGGGEYVDGGLCAPPGVAFAGNGTYMYDDNWGRSVAADLDNDGDEDLALRGKIWWNDGEDGFTQFTNVPFLDGPMEALDLDQDGLLDLIGANSGEDTSRQLGLFFGLGSGQFTSIQILPSFVDGQDDRIAIADFDEDGRLDVAAWNRSSFDDKIDIWMQTTARGFELTSLTIDEVYGLSSVDKRRVIAFDYDEDGREDLLVGPIFEDSGRMRWYHNEGAGQFTEAFDQMLGLVTRSADVDGDGDQDLLGNVSVRNMSLDASTGGLRRQFGISTPGTGGLRPTLGASGSFTVGGTVELHVTGGRGGSVAFLTIGGTESAHLGYPTPGLISYAYPAAVTTWLPLGGAANGPGSGSVTLPIVVPAMAAGLPFFYQAFVYDPHAAPTGLPYFRQSLQGDAPGIFTQTNGLEIRYP